MAAAAADKRRRVDKLKRAVPYVSASALEAILQNVRDEGLPERFDRKLQRELRNEVIEGDTIYGKSLCTVEVAAVDGGTKSVSFIHPFAMLSMACKQSAPFAELLYDIVARHQRLRLCVYSDEVTPCNAVSHHNFRKSQIIYWSFLEFGAARLCSTEELWFTMTAQRSDTVSTYAGGLGTLFKVALTSFFGHGTHTLHRSGVHLETPDGTAFRVFGDLAMILQDGSAHKYAFNMKGDAGIIACKSQYIEVHTCGRMRCMIAMSV